MRAYKALYSLIRGRSPRQELSELVAVELRSAIEGFSQVVGKIDNEAMLDKLFQKFCIGK